MAGKDLTITVTAKDGSSQTFKTIGAAASSMGMKVSESSEKASASMQKWSDAGQKLGLAFGAIGLLSSKIAGDAEASTARMETAFTNVGLKVDDFKDKISDLTGDGLKLAFDDEDVQDSLAQLIATTGNAEKAMRDVGIAEDLARAKGIDLAAATNIVNAAEAGRFRGLQQLGIQLDANATSEDAIAALQGRVAGQAAAYAATDAAAWERRKNAAENYLETVGDFVNQNGQMVFALSSLTVAAGPAIDGLKALTTAAKEAGAAQKLASVAMGPAGLIGVAALAGVAIYELEKRWDAQNLSTKEATKTIDDFRQSIGELAGSGSVSPEVTRRLTEYADATTLAAQKIQAARIELTKPYGPIVDPAAAAAGQFNVDTAAMQAHEDAINANILSETEFNKVLQQVSDIGLYKSALNADLVHTRMEQLNASLENGSMTVDDYAWNVNYLTENMTTYGLTIDQIANQTAAASSANEVMITSLYGSATAFQAEAKAVSDVTIAMRERQQNIDDQFIATPYSASLPVIGEYAAITEVATGITGQFAGAVSGAQMVTDPFADSIANLNAELSATDAASNAYNMVVGFTDGMVKGIATSKEWTDSISGALGTDFMPNGDPSALLSLLNQKKIDTEDYNEVLKAQKSIYDDNARAQEASQIIQIKQADVVAAGTEATADYLVALSKQDELQQSISLAYADPATAKRITDIADMAAGYSDMSDASKAAFEQTVTSAAALDPALAAVLESLGLIEATTENSTGWKLSTDTTESQSAMDTLVSTLQDLVNILADVYNLDVTTTFDDGGFWAAYNALPNSKTINVYTANGSYGPTEAIGGMNRFAKGGMVHLAEIGPEMLRYPSGAIGMAYTEGNYQVPNGTMVSTANATAHDLKGRKSMRPIHMQGCTFYITPATADLHDAISSTVLRGGL